MKIRLEGSKFLIQKLLVAFAGEDLVKHVQRITPQEGKAASGVMETEIPDQDIHNVLSLILEERGMNPLKELGREGAEGEPKAPRQKARILELRRT